ncbi:hypothetical protein AK812_SmicGene10967 [Symbiodinium microadriaticum]|uniref:Uncharacterized protein n=1 Tax=Symbiodinium microadriaticum TaxID=2951 RepID=A0A1Q9EEC0_SYMMI|nr:hypothetical protein AK812_SmicGene10967 [Symbiodinium microadriaticum]
MVASMQPAPELKEPKVVKHDRMPFTERMVSDAECKQAYQQVMGMRQNEYQRQALDKMVASMQPAPELKEPKVVKHDRRSLFQGHVVG